ncbi:MAG TPA: hypothetical protein VF832_13450 [Longimicrobiales bacterium]
MPSDERTTRTPAFPPALSGARETFRAAVTAAAEQVRGFVAAHSAPVDGAAERAAHELGPFAAGRLDPARFAALFSGAEPLDARALETLGAAYDVLASLSVAGDELFTATVHAGADLREAVVMALARPGRAFGAARVVELVRAGRYLAEEHGLYLEAFPPALWTRAERLLAPPVVLEVGGADLQVGGLADLLQGAQKIVLLVRAPAPPAPLVRLITPRTFVLQAHDAGSLAALAPVAGPAIAAVMPEGAVAFVHDPAAGSSLPTRLSLGALPAESPRAAIGHYSVAQQADELEQLTGLAHLTATALPGAANGSVPGGAQAVPATIADKLAAWLLQQAALPAV